MANSVDEKFFITYSWMRKDLKLKGLKSDLFAIIYGFAVQGKIFNGSLAYLNSLTGYSARNIYVALQELVGKGLIIQLEDNSKRRKPNVYTVNQNIHSTIDETSTDYRQNIHSTIDETSTDYRQNIHSTIDETSKNNIDNNINNNIDNSSSYIEADTKYRDNTREDAAAGAQSELEQRFQNKDFAEVVSCFSDNIHPLSGQIEAEFLGEMFDRYGKGWLMDAIREAVMNNGRSVKYIEAILKRWDKQGKGVKNNGSGINADGSRYSRSSRKAKVETMQDCADKWKGQTNGWKDH